MQRILIANRGEIAVRVIKTARQMGYETVAVYSEPDRHALHVKEADYAVALGGQSAAESYLDVEKVLAACRDSGADAVHPGYGFLSEQAHFAQALAEEGITFIGPSIKAIEAMGSKMESKRLMEAAHVPCVPGYHGDDQSDERLEQEARTIGFPVMVKASAGGGGKGMRLVHEASQMKNALRAARSEALNAFGDSTLLLEKAIIGPRHIEIQVFGDTRGQVVHLFERDCSVQRRHQKVIEEAPGVGISEELRQRMGAAAVAAARAIDYVGAGTVEFLLLPDQETFYFLEMNTRLQVEHPVTEMITGVDLVEWQLLVAEGMSLPLEQGDITRSGHAIEVRLYAEDPYQNFLPQSGFLERWEPHQIEGIRVDSGVVSGQEISPFYDPMLAKIIAHGPRRDVALRRLLAALNQSVVLGTRTNLGFLRQCLLQSEFVQGAVNTGFIESVFGDNLTREGATSEMFALAALVRCEQGSEAVPAGLKGWSSTMSRVDVLKLEEVGTEVEHVREIEVHWSGDETRKVVVWHEDECEEFVFSITKDDTRWMVRGGANVLTWRPVVSSLYREGEKFWVMIAGGEQRCFEDVYESVQRGGAEQGGRIVAPMSGKVLDVMVREGEEVKRGDIVVVLEAMKMEHELVALVDGTVAGVYVERGAQVMQDVLLVEIEEG